jgi:hypothetical protein
MFFEEEGKKIFQIKDKIKKEIEFLQFKLNKLQNRDKINKMSEVVVFLLIYIR